MTDNRALSAEVEDLVAAIHPLISGQCPPVVGMALADIVALYLAQHARELRDELLELHLETVERLMPHYAREIWGEGLPQ